MLNFQYFSLVIYVLVVFIHNIQSFIIKIYCHIPLSGTLVLNEFDFKFLKRWQEFSQIKMKKNEPY